MDGPRHRCVCVRCRAEFLSPVKFSQHLADCQLPFDADFVLQLLRVVKGQPDQCWYMNDPRGTVSIPKFGVAPKVTRKACHIVAEAVHGPCPDGQMLRHWCDDTRCLNWNHLVWGTGSENLRDAWRNGRRVMTPEQLSVLASGLTASLSRPGEQERRTEHNRRVAKATSGVNHWTKRDPEQMKRWKAAISAGRKEGDAE